MAERVRFVNTASTSGGDGTTNNTTGATRAYVSLEAADAGEAADLVAAGDNLVINCTGSAADTTQAKFGASWVTSPTSDVLVRVNSSDQSPDGIYSTSLYRIEVTGNYSESLELATPCDNFAIEGIQMSGTGTNYRGAVLTANNNTGATRRVERCIIKGTDLSGQQGITGTNRGNDYQAINNLLYDLGSGGLVLDGYMASGDLIVYSNTVDNCGNGVVTSTGQGTTTRFINNLLTNNTTDWNVGFTPDFTDNNVTSDATGPDTGHTSKTVTYTDASSGDYSTSDADVVELGTDLSADGSYAFDEDITNTSRTGNWDIGAFQDVAAPAGGDLLLTNRSIANYGGMRQ